MQSSKEPRHVGNSDDSDEDAEVQGRRVLKLNPALFDNDEND